MTTTIPPQHYVVLDGISKSQQVGGRVALMKLYEICASIFSGQDAPVADIATWKLETESLKIVAVTDLKTGVYVQLSLDKGQANGSTLMTVGKKFSIEVSDPVTSSRSSRMFL